MKVEFLGHIVSKDGLEVDPSKKEAVQKFLVPRNQIEVESFLCLASYYRRLVPNFTEIARPLHKASEYQRNLNGHLKLRTHLSL